MSTNRNKSTCDCGHQFTLGSFRGQPIEFRQNGDYAPQPGCKLTCPDCGKVYFGWIRSEWEFWSNESMEEFDKDEYTCPVTGKMRKNYQKGKFAKRITVPAILNNGVEKEQVVHIGYNQIDTAYYESRRDEGQGIDTDTPRDLFTGDTHEQTDWLH